MKCWDGWVKSGTQTINGRTCNRCVRAPGAGGVHKQASKAHKPSSGKAGHAKK